jgi:lipoate-protein ligase B
MSHDLARLEVRRLGRVPYGEALELQRRLVRERLADAVPDTLLLLEHDPVFTLGRRHAASANVLAPGDTPVVQVERGGDVTWHGPGQLVGYPVLKLGAGEQDIHLPLRRLERALIEVLARCGLQGELKPGHTGVWCCGKKLGSLGIAVERWVTFHGFALNVDCDLGWFSRINPCGLSSELMGSIASLGGRVPCPEERDALAAEAVGRAFGRRV